MKVIKFEDLIAWQKAQDLAVVIYKLFKGIRDFSFKDQICRAVVAISNNIAEGFERGTDRDFSRFLDIARSSCSEVRSMLYLAFRLEYITSEQRHKLLSLSNEISRLIYGLQKSLFKHASTTND
ncbi:MAG TPA: four helix bundle protein [Chitinophaga sp.]